MSAQEDMKHVKRCMQSDPVCLVGVNWTGGSSLMRAASFKAFCWKQHLNWQMKPEACSSFFPTSTRSCTVDLSPRERLSVWSSPEMSRSILGRRLKWPGSFYHMTTTFSHHRHKKHSQKEIQQPSQRDGHQQAWYDSKRKITKSSKVLCRCEMMVFRWSFLKASHQSRNERFLISWKSQKICFCHVFRLVLTSIRGGFVLDTCFVRWTWHDWCLRVDIHQP